jgi:hypothetical protein
MFEQFRSGFVFRYSYLWAREHFAGEMEGHKKRPAVVGFRVKKDGREYILIFPITTKQPSADRMFAEIPDAEKQRVGLDPVMRCWIILDEFNQETIGASYYLVKQRPMGRFSRSFFFAVAQRFIAERDRVTAVPRG